MKEKSFSLKSGLRKLTKNGVFIIFILVVTIFAIATGGKSIRGSNILNILVQTTDVGLMTIGMALVILDRGIDLSVGGAAVLSSSIGALCMVNWGIPWGISIVIMLLLGLLVGFINGITIAKIGVTPFICTLATLKISTGIAHFLLGGMTVFGLPDQHVLFGQTTVGPIPVSVLILVVVAAIGIIMLKYTKFGRELYAMGGNPKAAWMAGINVIKNRIIIYMISGLLSSVAALIITSRIMSASITIGSGSELDAIAGAVIGGVSMSGGEGGMLGAVLGALTIVMINNGLNLLGVSPFLQTAVKGMVIFMAVILDALQRRRNQPDVL